MSRCLGGRLGNKHGSGWASRWRLDRNVDTNLAGQARFDDSVCLFCSRSGAGRARDFNRHDAIFWFNFKRVALAAIARYLDFHNLTCVQAQLRFTVNPGAGGGENVRFPAGNQARSPGVRRKGRISIHGGSAA